MVNEEEIEILLNICYGGWNISKKAIDLYKLRNPSYNVTENDYNYYFNRHDHILYSFILYFFLFKIFIRKT